MLNRLRCRFSDTEVTAFMIIRKIQMWKHYKRVMFSLVHPWFKLFQEKEWWLKKTRPPRSVYFLLRNIIITSEIHVINILVKCGKKKSCNVIKHCFHDIVFRILFIGLPLQ